MSVALYMDHHVHSAITAALRTRGVDVITADEDGRADLADPALLTRATELGRVLVSMDRDLLVESARRQRAGEPFAGLVYGQQLGITIGRAVDDLETISQACDPTDMLNVVQRIPL